MIYSSENGRSSNERVCDLGKDCLGLRISIKLRGCPGDGGLR
jgi:hypothetical protein